MVKVPWGVSLSMVAVMLLCAASVSLARTLAAVLSRTVTVPPSATVALSLLATGGAVTGVTVIERSGEGRGGGEGGSRGAPVYLKKKREEEVGGSAALGT